MFDPTRYWYRDSLSFSTILLVPFAWIFGLCSALRRWLYRVGIFKTHTFTTPVVVVGNVVVGGTGKTPFVIWLANFLRAQGYFPGIVSRGYGGKKQSKPLRVNMNSLPEEVGDEAILLARQTNCPVVVCVDRVMAVQELLRQSNCNVVISDDGLQHYRLDRALEIAIVDGVRRFGNQFLLPAGPLREPIKRLEQVDYVIVNEGNPQTELTMTLVPVELVSVKNQNKIALEYFRQQKVHAVAGVGHPERFFDTLKNLGLEIIPHVFSDHYYYSQSDLEFNDTYPVIMTEKDAVKCKSFAKEHYWYLTVSANVNEDFQKKILLKLESLKIN